MKRNLFFTFIIFFIYGCSSKITAEFSLSEILSAIDPNPEVIPSPSPEVTPPSSIENLTAGYTYSSVEVISSGSTLISLDITKRVRIIDASIPSSLKKQSMYEAQDTVYNAVVNGNALYLFMGTNGIEVVDISTPTSPQLISSFSGFSGANIVSGIIDGNHLYAAGRDDGLFIVDISNPNSLSLITSYDTPGSARHLAKKDDVIFVADTGTIEVLDVSNFSSISTLFSYSSAVISSTYQIYVENNLGVISDGNGEVDVINISNPALISSHAHIDVSALYGDGNIELHDSILYMSIAENGVAAYDLSAPATPKNLGYLKLSGYAGGIVHNGTSLFVADNTGIAVIDTSDLNGIERIASVSLGFSYYFSVIESQNDVLFAMPALGIQVIDLSVPSSPAFRDLYDNSQRFYNIQFYGSYAYATNNSSDIEVLDISDLDSISNIRTITTSASRGEGGIHVANNKLYVLNTSTNPDSLDIYDLTVPADPVLISTTLIPENAYNGSIEGIKVKGDYIYFVEKYDGLVVYDISDPSSPTHVPTTGAKFNTSEAYRAFLKGDYIFVEEDYGGGTVFSIENPTAPKMVNNFYEWYGNFYGFEMQGDNLYTISGRSGIEIWDFSNPKLALSLSGYTDGLRYLNLCHDGNYLFAATEDQLDVFDISDNQGMKLESYFKEDIHYLEDILVAGDIIYAAEYYGWLSIIDISDGPTVLFREKITNGELESMYLDGSNLFVNTSDDFTIHFDVSNKTSPTRLTSDIKIEPKKCTYEIVNKGNYKLCTSYFSAYYLQLYDFSDSLNPAYIKETSVFHRNGYKVNSNGDIILVNGASGVFTVDTSDINNLSVVSIYDSPGDGNGVYLKNDIAYVADGNSGIAVLDVSDVSAVSVLNTVNDAKNFTDFKFATDNLLFYEVGFSGSTLHIYHLDDPTTPNFVKTYNFGSYMKMFSEGGKNYVLYRDGLYQFDIDDSYEITFTKIY